MLLHMPLKVLGGEGFVANVSSSQRTSRREASRILTRWYTVALGSSFDQCGHCEKRNKCNVLD